MKLRHCLAGIVLCSIALTSQAADKILFLSIADALNSEEAKPFMDGVKYYWGSQKTPAFATKTDPDDYSGGGNAWKNGAEGSCRQAFLNIIESMYKDARMREWDAVIELHSMFDGKPSPNDSEYECHAGTFSTRVTMVSRFARLKK